MNIYCLYNNIISYIWFVVDQKVYMWSENSIWGESRAQALYGIY